MMSYPPNQPFSGYSFAETFEQMVILRRYLLKLLAESGDPDRQQPMHSLFSSKRNYRTDELNQGLAESNPFAGFSLN